MRSNALRHYSGALGCTPSWYMRFDKNKGNDTFTTSSSPSNSNNNSSAHHHSLPESMMPRKVPHDFTPFPLPKYDTSLGFGPVRISDVPDIEAAKARMMKSASETALMEEGFLADLGDAPLVTSSSAAVDVADDAQLEDADPLGGYKVTGRFPIIDRIECTRSVDDLIQQFKDRPQREARTATVLDCASKLKHLTNEEVARVLYELGSIFTPDGNGLQFLVAKVVKYGRPYYVSSELMKAYIHLLDCLTENFVEEQPDRLFRSPAMFLQLLHFLALIKVCEPNKWHSPNPNAPQNRADYSHALGVNRTSANKNSGIDLLDLMEEIACDADFLAQCTSSQLLDMLGGFAGVRPDGLPDGAVTNAILQAVFQQWSERGYEVSTPQEVAEVERLYLLLNLVNIRNDSLLCALLGGAEATAALGVTPSVPLRLHASVQSQPRGPDFFASASRDRRVAVHQRALELFQVSVNAAREAGDAAALQALAESGYELLMTAKDKEAAAQLIQELDLDAVMLGKVAAVSCVAERLSSEHESRSARAMANFRAVQASADALPVHDSARSYVTTHKGKRVHPIRTLLADMPFVGSVDNVFLLHSTGVKSSVDPLINVAQRSRGGKDALIVTTSCCNALAHKAQTATEDHGRLAAQRALEIIGYEVERGRAIVVPMSEEVLIHDAGTYCDEDLMLWTMAAFLARHLPMVKVHTLMSEESAARNPYHTMKGEHSPMAASMDLYNRTTPLLRSLRSRELRVVTHHVKMRCAVRDRQSTLHNVNPIRSRFIYRRDRALFDRYHVHARNLAPGFSQGALNSDLRGLGFYTPDHPQVPYTPLRHQQQQQASDTSL